MKYFKLFYVIIFSFFLTNNIYSAENYVFAPFVSRLKAVEENSLIKLTWKDTGDIKGTCLIYRHTEKISRNNFNDACLLAEISKGIEQYTDTAMSGTDFYYSVLVKNTEDKIFDIFIPYRNVTFRPVSISKIKKIQDNITKISYLRVSEKKDSLYLTFRTSNPDRNTAVLRSHSPVFTVDDVKNADLLAVISSGKESYTDFPIAGIPCYYTVVDAELLKSFNIDIVPFENTTISPSEIKITEKTIQDYIKTISLRPEPLPSVLLDRNLETGNRISSSSREFFPFRKTSAETDMIIKSITEKEIKEKEMEQELLNKEDFYNYKEDLQLSVLINRYFFIKDWENLEIKLRDYIRSSRSKSLVKRASFYLGQAYYFTGNYEKAFMEFLTSSESYYPESKKWMDNILLSKL